MDPDLTPILLLALAGRNQGNNGKELVEAVLFSSNRIPQGARTVFSVKAIQDRAQAQAQQDDATAQEIFKAFAGRLNNTIDDAELKQFPSLERLLSHLQTDDRGKIVSPPKNILDPGSDSDGTSPPLAEKKPTSLVVTKQK